VLHSSPALALAVHLAHERERKRSTPSSSPHGPLRLALLEFSLAFFALLALESRRTRCVNDKKGSLVQAREKGRKGAASYEGEREREDEES